MKYWTILSAVVFASLAMSSIAAAPEAATPPTKSKVLFLIGGFPGHDTKAEAALFKPILEATGQFTVNVTDDRDQFKKENIFKYDLVVSAICTREDNFTKEWEDGLSTFVASGKGFVGLHGSTDAFWNSDVYWKVLGGRITTHERGAFKVIMTGKSHPIVKGLPDFQVNSDETYCHKFHPQSKVIVLARRDFDNEPAAWIQYYGKGRVFCTGLGHDHTTWDIPEYQQLFTRACLWATKKINP